MHSVDEEVISKVREWLAHQHSCWLATVIGTWGSSPRPVGSLLGCDADGHIVGSLSGGCVEDDLLEKLTRGELARDHAQFFTYGVSDEESEKFGLPCGGSLRIVIEPLKPDPDTRTHVDALCEGLHKRRHVKRTVDLVRQQRTVAEVDGYEPLSWDEDSQLLCHVYGPQQHLFIIGAGMVSQYLASMALFLDYTITVCDPRQQMLDDFPVAGVNRVCDMPDDAIRAMASDASSAIVALTHDPRIDDMGLMEALTTDAFYVGALGSTRTSANRRERLKALDLNEAQLARLHAPVGLSIGSKTPPEIAVAILAEITAVKANARQAAVAELDTLSVG
jgi:xanthine dehydrogenase accessory factor